MFSFLPSFTRFAQVLGSQVLFFRLDSYIITKTATWKSQHQPSRQISSQLTKTLPFSPTNKAYQLNKIPGAVRSAPAMFVSQAKCIPFSVIPTCDCKEPAEPER